MVSPPTRGWTHSDGHGDRSRLGFPAHAGMDRRRACHLCRSRRFPRPRGDGPLEGAHAHVISVVSPPTRGWTSSRLRSRRRACGFPAHAGMDLEHLELRFRQQRFPRPRGDGPVQPGVVPIGQGVSPPTRGWTSRGRQGCRPSNGFPAHAGMDHSVVPSIPPRARFPRPRGDGPHFHGPGGGRMRVSPPTRGWTSTRGVLSLAPCGFPAHAGMDLRSTPSPPCSRRFPRPRGDGP